MSHSTSTNQKLSLNDWICNQDIDPYVKYYHLVGPSSNPFYQRHVMYEEPPYNNDQFDEDEYYAPFEEYEPEIELNDDYETDSGSSIYSDSEDEVNDWMF